MPLTAKGTEILSNMDKEYGAEKGKRVFYASRNAGTISGVDSARVDALISGMDALATRMDAAVEGEKTPKQPYGEDNTYADPGYQSDKKKRYPLGSAEEVRAAWNYIHKGRDADKYSPEHLSEIKSRIVRAWKAKIGKEGPPEAAEK